LLLGYTVVTFTPVVVVVVVVLLPHFGWLVVRLHVVTLLVAWLLLLLFCLFTYGYGWLPLRVTVVDCWFAVGDFTLPGLYVVYILRLRCYVHTTTLVFVWFNTVVVTFTRLPVITLTLLLPR